MLWMLFVHLLGRAVFMFLFAAFMVVAVQMKSEEAVMVFVAVLPLTMMNVSRSRFVRGEW
jgi:hypothetical protein